MMWAQVDADVISFMSQVALMGAAAIVGRFLKSLAAIWLVSFFGAFAAMVAAMMGGGALSAALLLFTPLIYFFAVAGRSDTGSRL